MQRKSRRQLCCRHVKDGGVGGAGAGEVGEDPPETETSDSVKSVDCSESVNVTVGVSPSAETHV